MRAAEGATPIAASIAALFTEPGLQPSCCRRDGVLWDLAAFYPAEMQWTNAEPLFIDGPVVAIPNQIQQRLSK
jgi:hypothetical protein